MKRTHSETHPADPRKGGAPNFVHGQSKTILQSVHLLPDAALQFRFRRAARANVQ
jgi:hypothetical protein